MKLTALILLVFVMVAQFPVKHALWLRNETAKDSTNIPKPTDADERRFKIILSDPANLKIPRCRHAGKVIQNGDVVVLSNGIVVTTYGYYGGFSKILQQNAGVHEAGEEWLFSEIINRMKPGATVVEFGSYWAYYTIWFSRAVPNAHAFAIEAAARNMAVGQRNAALNGVNGTIDWTTAFVDNGFWATFAATKHISQADVMLMDIQSYEKVLLPELVSAITRGVLQVKYMVIGTHEQALHMDCVRWVKQAGLRIVAAIDLEQSFFADGMIVATSVPVEAGGIPFTAMDGRQTTPLLGTPQVKPNPKLPCKLLPQEFSKMLEA